MLFVVDGELRLTVDGTGHDLGPGGYAYLPPGCDWTLRNSGAEPARFHWIRKAYERVEGVAVPPAFVTNERDVEPTPMPDTDGVWTTTRFVDPDDIRHDMHVNIVTFAARRGDPLPRDPRDGARALRPGGQGRLPAQRGLGRGRGRRLHVAARVLPAGLLRRWPRPRSATCSTRTSTGTCRWAGPAAEPASGGAAEPASGRIVACPPRPRRPSSKWAATHASSRWVDAEWRAGPECAHVPLRSDAPAAEILDGLAACVAALGELDGRVLAAAVPGPFDYDAGIGRYRDVGKYEALNGVDVRAGLTERLPSPPARITFLNDAQAFGLGEWLTGAGRPYTRVLAITLGTGVGSAFVDDGTVVTTGDRVPPEENCT